jgi:hypothetical protein
MVVNFKEGGTYAVVFWSAKFVGQIRKHSTTLEERNQMTQNS